MRYTYFAIENFKGVESVVLRLDKTPRAPVYTLVGLNESGKTTILEAINLLTYRDELDPLDLPGYFESDVHDLIPIAKRANFNGSITIKAGISVDEADNVALAKHMRVQHKVALTTTLADIEVTQSYKFVNSRLAEGQPRIVWTMPLKGIPAGRRKERGVFGDALQGATDFLKGRLPRIQYFPNFLFEFPDKIYLEDVTEDKEKDQFYRAVLQD